MMSFQLQLNFPFILFMGLNSRPVFTVIMKVCIYIYILKNVINLSVFTSKMFLLLFRTLSTNVSTEYVCQHFLSSSQPGTSANIWVLAGKESCLEGTHSCALSFNYSKQTLFLMLWFNCGFNDEMLHLAVNFLLFSFSLKIKQHRSVSFPLIWNLSN